MNNEELSQSNTRSLKELAHGASISFVFGMIGYFLMFFFKLFASRYFGPTEYGVFEMVNTFVSFAMVFAMLGISGGISRFIPIYKHRQEAGLLSGYLKFIFQIPFIISCFVGFLFFLFSNQITDFFNFPAEMSVFIKIISLLIPVKTTSQIIRSILVAEKKILYKSFSADFLDRITLIFGLFAIYILHLPLIFAIFTLALSILVPFLFELFIYFKKISFPKTIKAELKNKEWILFSIPLFFSGFFSFFIHWSDNLLIGKLLNAHELGIYAIAFSLGSFLAFFQSIFSTIFLPLISECHAQEDNSKINFLFKKAASWTFGLSLPIFLYFVIYGKELLGLLYGNEYKIGYWPLVISALGYLFFVSIGLNESLLVLYKKTGFLFKISVVSAVINVILGFILIYYFGILGAATATALSLALRGWLALIKIKEIAFIQFDNIQNLKFLISGIISALILLFVKTHLTITTNILVLLVISLFLTFLYGIFLFIFRSYSKEDKAIFMLFKNKILSLIFIK